MYNDISMWEYGTYQLTIANDEDEGGAGGDNTVNVIDIVEGFKLQEIQMDKKGWSIYIKGMT